MTKPINMLTLRFNPAATVQRGWQIYIDNQALLTLLDDSIPSGNHWREKKDTRLNMEQLSESAKQSGNYALLICAHCAELGYLDCGDLLLREVRVRHEGEFIRWEIDPPGFQYLFDEAAPLHFSFHQPQYEKAIEKAVNSPR